MLSALCALALANGQSTHVWISLAAIDELPEGELKDFVSREDLYVMLVNGTMFPDGGYPQDDDYGEMAHWEPFQNSYRDWIRATWGGPPWPAEAEPHIAFWLGMASHGMADQTHDAMYMERAKVYDADMDWGNSMDEACDVAFIAGVGPQEVVEDWVPTDVFVDLYATNMGYTVTADTLSFGQSLLRVAISYVGTVAENPDAVANYSAWFPWATTHLEEDIPGAPATEAVAVARYWEQLWAELNGTAPATFTVLHAWPADGGYGQPTDATSIESMVSLMFADGLDPATITTDTVQVVDETGAAHPITVGVFYGYSSHVVNIRPTENWAENMDYTVQLTSGVGSFDGNSATAGSVMGFSTRPPPEVEEEETTPQSDAKGGCGCTTGPPLGLPLGLLSLLWLRRRSGPR